MDARRGFWSDYVREFFQRCFPDFFDRFKMSQQFVGGLFADAGNLLNLGYERIVAAFQAVEGDGKTVRLIPYLLHEQQAR